MAKPTIICMTPIKNEAWILHRFLKCTSLWADHIIIADQGSTDGSREIALSYPKVTLIDNPSQDLNEASRQNLLLNAAREIPGQRFLIALDADEVLTPNLDHPEWQTVLNAAPGTIVEFEWLHILPDFKSYWLYTDWYYPLGFMDDGSNTTRGKIHSPRIPEPLHSPRIRLRQIKILHYQYTSLKRVRSKQRWYQCWERINRPEVSAINSHRMYQDVHSFPQNELYPFCHSWFAGYEKQGIDMTSICIEPTFWRDEEVLGWMSKYGTHKFKKLAIWDTDWSELAKQHYPHVDVHHYDDPRNWFDKLIHLWLKETQPFRENILVRIVDKLLSVLGW